MAGGFIARHSRVEPAEGATSLPATATSHRDMRMKQQSCSAALEFKTPLRTEIGLAAIASRID